MTEYFITIRDMNSSHSFKSSDVYILKDVVCIEGQMIDLQFVTLKETGIILVL